MARRPEPRNQRRRRAAAPDSGPRPVWPPNSLAIMRFGMFVPQGWRLDLAGIDAVDHWAVMRGVAERADAGPWESIWVYDHFHTSPVPTDEATHEAWTLMAALAAVTSRVRLGQMCTCMGYRNPAYLAKVAATIDVISGGRVEMGIGAGWYEHEWRAYGYGFPSAGERLAMLDEGVQIMQRAVGRAAAPVRRRALPGRRCDLSAEAPPGAPASRCGSPVVASRRHCGSPPSTRRTRTSTARPTGSAQVRGSRRALQGRRPGLRRDHPLGELQRDHRRDRGRGAGQARLGSGALRTRPAPTQLAVRRAQYASGPLVGTPEQIVDTLRRGRRLGMAYAICYFVDAAHDRSQHRAVRARGHPRPRRLTPETPRRRGFSRGEVSPSASSGSRAQRVGAGTAHVSEISRWRRDPCHDDDPPSL